MNFCGLVKQWISATIRDLIEIFSLLLCVRTTYFMSSSFFVSFLEYPDMPIPKVNPCYVSPHPFMHKSTRFAFILNAEIHWENITVYGAQNAVVQEIRYHLILL